MLLNTYRFQDSRMNGLRVVLDSSVLRYISMVKCMGQLQDFLCLQDIQKLNIQKRKHTIQGTHSLPVLTIMYLMEETT